MPNQDKIAEQAKKIMDSFMSALKKAEEVKAPVALQRDPNIRPIKAELKTNPDFRERTFKNAPKTKDDCIVAEKKKW